MDNRKRNTVTAIDILLPEVKENLILDHDEDDVLLKRCITNAIAYAETYQKKPTGAYSNINDMPLTTRQAVVMLASHYYESRDGSTGGFFTVSVLASTKVNEVVNNILRLERDWQV
jgi:uncharacterized phage protein (predicted DNA packaging)